MREAVRAEEARGGGHVGVEGHAAPGCLERAEGGEVGGVEGVDVARHGGREHFTGLEGEAEVGGPRAEASRVMGGGGAVDADAAVRDPAGDPVPNRVDGNDAGGNALDGGDGVLEEVLEVGEGAAHAVGGDHAEQVAWARGSAPGQEFDGHVDLLDGAQEV